MRWLLTYPEDGPSVSFYLQWVKRAGVEPHLLSSDYADPGPLVAFDALLLPGGGDVDPSRYGAVAHPKTSDVLPHRDALEARLVAEFLEAGKPVFGICRGLQMLNVVLGGALLQHVPDILAADGAEVHAARGYDARHGLQPDLATRLGAVLNGTSETNSSHHQCIDPARLGRGLHVAARSPAGVIEAVEDLSGGRRIAAVQWHPERLPANHPASERLAHFLCALV